MNPHDTRIYLAQSISLIIVYIISLLIVIGLNPVSSTMDCNSNHTCNITEQYRWNFRYTSDDFYICKNTKIKFPYNSTNQGYYVVLQGHDIGCSLDIRPFGDENIYKYSNSNISEDEFIENYKQEFKKYKNGINDSFVMTTGMNQRRFYIISGILTLIFMGLLLNRRPIDIILHFLEMFR